MAKRTSKNEQIFSTIIAEFKDQNRADIRKWRNALVMARNIDDPRQWMLQDLYDNLSSDGHLQAQMNIRKSATTSYPFSIIDKSTGKPDDEKTDMFLSEWFFDFMDSVLDSVFRGYTLLELADTENIRFDTIPYRNIAGTKQRVLKSINGSGYINIAQGYELTLIHAGKPDSLGLLADLCGQLIWKRNAQQSWAEFAEKFGMPLIVAHTASTDPAEISRIRGMIDALGEAARAVLPEGSALEVIPFQSGDAFQVYNQMIERINGEIAKPITGGTMITDDGSSRSQSEVHKDNLDYIVAERDRRMVQFVVNNQLIPMLHFWRHDIPPEKYRFKFDKSFELSPTEHWNIVNQVLNRYEIPTDWISETFNVPITGERKTDPAEAGDEAFAASFR